jgi:hypothetical protein
VVVTDRQVDGLLDPIGALWAEVLEIERVGPDDDFLDLGGHSLAAIKITAAVRDMVSEAVPLDLIFRHLVLHEYVDALAEFAA